MPNHIDNVLTIVGPDDAVRAFVDKAHGCRPNSPPSQYDLHDWGRRHPGEPYPEMGEPCRLEFHRIVPLPDDYATREYSNYGYQAECRTWGVKWGAYKVEGPALSPGAAVYRFRTAWACPRTWLRKASVSWPGLTLVCSYGGEGPARGRCAYRAGEALRDETDTYDEADYPSYESFVPDENGPEAAEQERAYNDAHKRAEHKHIHVHDEFVKDVLSS